MKPREMLALNTGDKINYAGKTGFVCDWICNHEPTFAADGTRIDAEPVFKFSDGLKHTIHPRFWSEVNKH